MLKVGMIGFKNYNMPVNAKPVGFGDQPVTPESVFADALGRVKQLDNPVVVMDFQGTIVKGAKGFIPGVQDFIKGIDEKKAKLYIVTNMSNQDGFKRWIEGTLNGLIAPDNFKGIKFASGAKQSAFAEIMEAHESADFVFVGDKTTDFPNNHNPDNCFQIPYVK